MARIRSVKPEICESETIARLSAEVERTFVRLWTHLDDHGRAKDNPHLIVAALFPLLAEVTVEVVDQHLDVLAGEGLIVRYVVDGTRYLACPSWAEHQHPQKPRPSKIPPPSDGVPYVSRTTTDHVTEPYGPVVVVGEVAVEVEVEGLSPHKSQDYTGSEPAEPSHHDEPAAAPDEQAIRKTAALVGRAVASAQAGIGNPGAYAAGVTRQILDRTGDGIDRERIVRLLISGQTPEEIASGWAVDPFGFPADSEPAPVGPDLAAFYAGRESRRREQMADQVPADRETALVGLRAARAAMGGAA